MTNHIIRFILVLILFSLPSHLFGQNNNQNQGVSGLNSQFNSTIGGYYYFDAISSMALERLTPVDGVVDQDYVLGPNDIITVSISSTENFMIRALLVNSQGDIVIPQIGTINIDGKTIFEATKIINTEVGKVLKNPVSKVTLEFAKENTLHIYGGVPYPGKHILPPFTRVDEALYQAVFETLKPTSDEPQLDIKTSSLLAHSNLSLRNIKIIHLDGSTSSSDLYAYFKAGIIDQNPLVKHGDQIVVNTITPKDPKVGISGAVQHNLELEYNTKDTPNLLIKIAGGFKNEADSSKIYVYRNIDKATERLEVPNDEWDRFKLQPYDRIVVPTLHSENYSASAKVIGEVEIPGDFPIKSGETTALELLNLAGNLTERALPAAAHLIRAGSIENEIPNKFNTDLMKRTSDQLAQGLQYLDTETRLSRSKVYINLTDEDQLSKVKIYAGDQLYVPRDEETIFVFGQINNPGYYPFTGNNISVTDYISKAGGFALSADRDRIFIIKTGNGTWYKPGETTLESGDRIFIDRVPYDELNALRTYDVQKEQIKNTRIQLIMTGISTITGIITTYVAIQNIRN